ADVAAWLTRARRRCDRNRPFTSIAYELAQWREDVRGRPLDVRATYHDACQSANVLGLHDEPRELLRRIAGVQLVEMKDSSVCCGFGGTFSFEYPEVAQFVLDKKLANIAATGADIVITDNPGCLTHLKGAFDARSKPTRVRHLAEVLWESLSDA